MNLRYFSPVKPIFLSLSVLCSVLSAGLCLSTPFQLPLLGLPLAEQKIEVLSDRLHFPTGKARNAQHWEGEFSKDKKFSRLKQGEEVLPVFMAAASSLLQDSPKEAQCARMSC